MYLQTVNLWFNANDISHARKKPWKNTSFQDFLIRHIPHQKVLYSTPHTSYKLYSLPCGPLSTLLKNVGQQTPIWTTVKRAKEAFLIYTIILKSRDLPAPCSLGKGCSTCIKDYFINICAGESRKKCSNNTAKKITCLIGLVLSAVFRLSMVLFLSSSSSFSNAIKDFLCRRERSAQTINVNRGGRTTSLPPTRSKGHWSKGKISFPIM